MSQKRKSKQGAKSAAATKVRRRIIRFSAVGLAVAVIAAVGFWCSTGHRAGTSQHENDAAKQPASTAQSKPAFEKLIGYWQRPDGGYLIEIRSVDGNGKMEAGYFNPQPINVAQAEAAQDAEKINVFIELRDVNYPGSTYTLTYEPTSDQLVGIYFQAVLQQRYEVYFERLK